MLDEDVENGGDDSKPPQPAVFGSVGGGGRAEAARAAEQIHLFFTRKLEPRAVKFGPSSL